MLSSLFLLAVPSHARQPTLKRFHLVSSALQKRLSSNTRLTHNLQSVGQLHHGTAFLVERPRSDGTALMLTARHVTTSCRPGKTRVQFQPEGMGGKVQSGVFRRVVAQSKKLDYALVEVSLPSQLRKLEPVRFAPSLGSGHRLYSVSYPMFETTQYLARNRQNAHLVRNSFWSGVIPRGRKNRLRIKTIASGEDTSSGRIMPMRTWFSLYGRPLFPISRARQRVNANVPAIGGASGSPVFSSETHEVRGITTVGGAMGETTPLQWLWGTLRGRRLRGTWETGYTSIASVKKDITSQLARGALDVGDGPRLQQLLAR
jgi:hypothetical protein